MERIIQYSRQESRGVNAARAAALSIFLYELPDLTACNVFPPRHILNTLLQRGWAGGNLNRPFFTWKPFEISEQELQELLPKLLNPDWRVLSNKLWRIRLPMKIDPEFDDITDRYAWMEAVCKKHGTNSLEEAEQEINLFKSEVLKKLQ